MRTATKGSFIPVQGHEGWWEVCLGGGTYAVNSDEGLCTCPSFERPWDPLWTAPIGHSCKHTRALAAYLERQRQCEVCSGRGAISLRCSYPDGRTLICAACDGTGLKPADLLPSQEDLKRLFR